VWSWLEPAEVPEIIPRPLGNYPVTPPGATPRPPRFVVQALKCLGCSLIASELRGQLCLACRQSESAWYYGLLSDSYATTTLEELAASRPQWMRRAVCRGQNTAEVFFPTRGEDLRAARLVCRRCPVQDACLDYALEHSELKGIWSSTGERTRARLRRQRAKASPASPEVPEDGPTDANGAGETSSDGAAISTATRFEAVRMDLRNQPRTYQEVT